MIKLLHSKLFRQNLLKWIFMYIAALGLLTSVITYSKYITTLIHDENARSAKFQVDISPMMPSCTDKESGGSICSLIEASSDICSQPTTNNPDVTYEMKSYVCPVTSYRPTKAIEFFFKIDLSEMEVSSDILIRTEPRDKYLSIEKIELVSQADSSKVTTIPGPIKHDGSLEYQKENVVHTDEGNGLIHIGVDVTDQERTQVYYFKVTAKYNFSSEDMIKDDIVFNNDGKSDTIRIGFSALQRENR